MADKTQEMFDKLEKVENILLTFSITNKCSLKCRHCFEEASPDNNSFLSLEKMIETMDDTKVSFKSRLSPIADYNIRITGGDPFLHPDLYNFLDYLDKNKEELRFQTSEVETNGWWAKSDEETYKVISQLKELKLTGLSMTDDEYHRENSSFDILSHGERIKRISNDLELRFRFITGLGFGNATPVGRARFEVEEEKWFKVYPVHCNLDKQGSLKDGYYFGDICKSKKGYGLLKDTVYYINSNGDVFPCESGKKFNNCSLSFGNVYEKRFSDIINSKTPVLESLKRNGVKGLYQLYHAEENYQAQKDRLGDCGACHELLRKA